MCLEAGHAIKRSYNDQLSNRNTGRVFVMDDNDMIADPLGARDDIIHVENLTRWNFTQLPEQDEFTSSDRAEEQSPFPWRNDLNSKVILWNGDVTLLGIDAIVHPTNEKLTDRTSLSSSIYGKAGPKLLAELRNNIKVCKTGDAKLSEGYNLIARYIIHTVGPRYNVKYVTAAEGALFTAYRNVLNLVRENSIRTLGLSCIHAVSRGYPPHEGAHIAIRTVRRFLEKYGSEHDAIIFVCTDETYAAYEKLLQLYFPRSPKEERHAMVKLPKDIGDNNGEPIIADRQIRIVDKPTFVYKDDSDFEKTVDLNKEFGASIMGEVGRHPFAHMEENPDESKRTSAYKRESAEQRLLEQRKRYERLLKLSKSEDLTDLAALRCLYRTGQDRFGRPVVVFVGKNFPAAKLDLERALLYLVRVMDPVVEKDYVIVYFHTNTTNNNLPPMNFMKTVYSVLDHRYKKHLKSFYIIHPTWWSKLATWFFTTFTASDIKKKVTSLKGVQFLYNKINPDQLDIPPFVLDHDIKINGPRYCVPFDESPDREGL